MQIVGRRLPGLTWGGHKGVHLGVQRGTEVIGLVPGLAADAVFDIEVFVEADANGKPDFRGPYVQGRRGERFVYLSWGEVADDGAFTTFRRVKLHLAPLSDQNTVARLLAAERLQAVLELTDPAGRPIAASLRPPWVTWRLLGCRE
jgi:hypothetical protein